MIDDARSYEEQLAVRANALSTVCVHAGDEGGVRTGPLDPALVLSSAFAFRSAEEAAGAFRGENDSYIYGRWGNPNVDALEVKLAALEGAEAAAATASGMAAISGAVLSICGSGHHLVAPRSMYAESARLFRERLPRLGIQTTFVDAKRADAYAEAIRPETVILYLETPCNPVLAVTDLAKIARMAKEKGLVTICDNTFATPFAQNPLALGVDLVVHSMTKALGGHGDAIGGALCGAAARIEAARDVVVKGFGGVLAPFNAFLVDRGLRTFALRQRQACGSAAVLAERLSRHPRVARVFHPSLASHNGHAVARAQMHAYGSLLSFELRPSKGAPIDAGKRVLEAVRVIAHAVSLGDVRSLLVHPASTTHSTMPPETRALADVTDGLLRLSVGIEGTEDLWRDLEAALALA
jgi:methionine-gamma-lyase